MVLNVPIKGAFNIKFQNKEGKEEYGYQTSWGISTRLLGGVIMAHGDDRGLKLPPKVAPIQIVIIPVAAHKEGVIEKATELKNKLEEKFDISAQNIYGLTEVMGPGVSTECHIKEGMHIAEDHFYPEIIDPETLEVLPEGEEGEIVFTSLTKTGMPVIRYRTKDLTSLNYEKCKCGRTTVRMNRITGRSDDMLKVKGVIVFPKQIEEVIMEMKELSPAYQIVVSRPDTLDVIEVQVEIDQVNFSDSMMDLEAFKHTIAKNIKEAIGIGVKVTLAEPYSLPRSEGKAVRVIDKRNFN